MSSLLDLLFPRQEFKDANIKLPEKYAKFYLTTCSCVLGSI